MSTVHRVHRGDHGTQGRNNLPYLSHNGVSDMVIWGQCSDTLNYKWQIDSVHVYHNSITVWNNCHDLETELDWCLRFILFHANAVFLCYWALATNSLQLAPFYLNPEKMLWNSITEIHLFISKEFVLIPKQNCHSKLSLNVRNIDTMCIRRQLLKMTSLGFYYYMTDTFCK